MITKKIKKNAFNYTYVVVCALCFFLFIHGKAQVEYIGNQGEVIGTSDSRMVISILETEEHVKFEVTAVGEILADGFSFTMVYQPSSLILTDSTFLYDVPLGSPQDFGSPVISKNPEFVNLFPHFYTSVVSHRTITGGEATGMRYLITGVGVSSISPSDVLHPIAGQMVPIYTIYFRKANSGSPLSISDFGFYNNERIPRIFSSWIYRGVSVTFGKAGVNESFYQNPDLFTYRSPSSVKMIGVSAITSNAAVLNGVFNRGVFSPTNNIIVSGISSSTNTGRLNYDQINKCGFIYSDTDAEIAISGVPQKIIIDGIEYDFPGLDELNTGIFMQGGKLFNITFLDNNSRDQIVNFRTQINGLQSETNYHVWPIIQYAFETSDNYFKIGGKNSFKTGIGSKAQKRISEINNQEDMLIIYPNPATDFVNIVGNADGKICIYHIAGRKIYEKDISAREKIEIKNLISGAYVVIFKNVAGEAFNKSLIIK